MDEEEIKNICTEYVDELFAFDDMSEQENIEAKNDAFVMCMAFAGHILEKHCIVPKKLILKEWHEVESTGTYAMSQQDAELADKACEMLDMLRRLFGEWLNAESWKGLIDLISVFGQTSDDNRIMARGLLSKIQNLANSETNKLNNNG